MKTDKRTRFKSEAREIADKPCPACKVQSGSCRRHATDCGIGYGFECRCGTHPVLGWTCRGKHEPWARGAHVARWRAVGHEVHEKDFDPIDKIRAADEALTAAGVPSKGKSLAERIEMLAANVDPVLRALNNAPMGKPWTAEQREELDRAVAAIQARRLRNQETRFEQMMGHLCSLPLDPDGQSPEDDAIFEQIEADVRSGTPGVDIEPQAGGLGMVIAEAVRRYGLDDPAKRATFNAYQRQAPRVVLTPHRGAFVASFREEHGITQQQLATALRIDVGALQALEAGQQTTDAAGWAQIQTALFILASKPAEQRDTEAGYIADPMSRPNIDALLSAENDEPQSWSRDIGPLDT